MFDVPETDENGQLDHRQEKKQRKNEDGEGVNRTATCPLLSALATRH